MLLMIYKTIAIAGTFDHLHKGHEYFISEAFKLGEKVIIGLTSDEYAQKKFKVRESDQDTSDKNKKAIKTPGTVARLSRGSFQVEEPVKIQIQNYQIREEVLKSYLGQQKLLTRARIIKINDLYGPAILDNEIEALAVTSDTLAGGKLVNRRRRELGLKPLKLLKVPIIKAQDKRKISSTRIRLGEIDRWGRLYKKLGLWGTKISDRLRLELRNPIGTLVKGNENNILEVGKKVKEIVLAIQPVLITTVGDQVTKMCQQLSLPPNLSIFDFKVKRIKIYRSISDLQFTSVSSDVIKTVKNPSGHITQSLVSAIRQSYKSIDKKSKQKLIKIIGEDDLAGVPAILLSPLGSVVIYGQPGEGVVIVEVTQEVKLRLLKLIARYKSLYEENI